MHIDVGFDNLLAVHNTRLLRTYSRIDPRFRQMVMIVKHWAKQRSINDTYSGTLSSYAYVVMVVHFLQYACEPPILPCLQRLPPDGRNEILLTVGGNSDETDRQQQQMFNIYFLEDLDQLDRWWPWRGRNHTSIGRLLYLFFHYWSYEFDYKNSVASIRTGGLMTKDEKNWVPLLEQQSAAKKEEEGAVEVGKSSQSDPPALEQEMLPSATEGADQKQNGDDKQQTEPATVKKERLQRYWVCIEDPFECTHNLGRPVGRDSLYFIRGEFLKACGILTNPKHYPRQYVQALYQGLASVVDAPPLLRLLCEETTYKTREEHKQRNKENREFSDKRRGSETADRQEKKSGSTAPAATKSDDNSTKMQPVSGKSADKPAAAAKQQQPQQQQQKPAQKQQKQKQKQSSNNSGEIKGASKEFAGTAIKSPLSPSATDPRKSDNNKERKRPPQHKQKKN
jgi:hypothetical protein